MSPLSFEDALRETSDDPTAYNIGADDPNKEEKLQKARETAAQNLIAGTAANDAYWNSRTELEQIMARAQGHGQVKRAEDDPQERSVLGTQTEPPAIEGTAVDESTTPTETGPAPSESPVSATEPTATPTPPSSESDLARLRAQIESLGGTPEV